MGCPPTRTAAPTCERCGCADPESSVCGECWALWYDCEDCSARDRAGVVSYAFCLVHTRPRAAASPDDAGHERNPKQDETARGPLPAALFGAFADEPDPSFADVGGDDAPVAAAVALAGTRLWALGQRLGKRERQLREWAAGLHGLVTLVRDAFSYEGSSGDV